MKSLHRDWATEVKKGALVSQKRERRKERGVDWREDLVFGQSSQKSGP